MGKCTCGSCVEDVDFVLVGEVPGPARIRVGGDALEDDLGGTVQQGPIRHIRVACDTMNTPEAL